MRMSQRNLVPNKGRLPCVFLRRENRPSIRTAGKQRPIVAWEVRLQGFPPVGFDWNHLPKDQWWWELVLGIQRLFPRLESKRLFSGPESREAPPILRSCTVCSALLGLDTNPARFCRLQHMFDSRRPTACISILPPVRNRDVCCNRRGLESWI